MQQSNFQSFADILKKKSNPAVRLNINTSNPNLTSDVPDNKQLLAQTSSKNKIRKKIDIKEESNQTSFEKSFSNALKISANKNAGKGKDRNGGNSFMKIDVEISSRKPMNLDSINLRRMRKGDFY